MASCFLDSLPASCFCFLLPNLPVPVFLCPVLLCSVSSVQLLAEKNEVMRRAEERMLMWDEDYRVLHEAVDKWFNIAEEYRTLYRKAELKIAKQHGRTRTGGKPGRPRKQPLPSPPQMVMKITPIPTPNDPRTGS